MKMVIIGAGGQARVVYEILKHSNNMEVVAFIDNVLRGSEEKIMGVPVIGDHSALPTLIKKGIKGYTIAIGDNKIRARYYNSLKKMKLDPINAIHPTAHYRKYALWDGLH